MKKIFAVILSSLILCTAAACSSGEKNTSAESKASSVSSQTESSEASEKSDKESSLTPAELSDEEDDDVIRLNCDNAELKEELESIIDQYEYQGIVYIAKGGKPIAVYAGGEPEEGIKVNEEIPMPAGSVSKQFCAAAILKLQEEGKLSIEDSLSKYYPEYEKGKDIQLKHLLSMRAGIMNFNQDLAEKISDDYTYEQNSEAVKKVLFEHDLNFETDSKFEYSNSNYFLLADIIEQVTGERYEAYLRKKIFEPLGMKHTGTINEMLDGAEWTNGAVYKKVDSQRGLTKGAGDILSTGEDMTLWLNGLAGGKVISGDSYKLMTTVYSPGNDYCYGLYSVYSGIGHPGAIGQYTAYDYINTEKDITLFIAASTLDTYSLTNLVQQIVFALIYD